MTHGEEEVGLIKGMSLSKPLLLPLSMGHTRNSAILLLSSREKERRSGATLPAKEMECRPPRRGRVSPWYIANTTI